jgi:hypothetical protein
LSTRKRSPHGNTCTSSQSFETSIPTHVASILSHPCLIGLRLRPRRLFGFDGTADDGSGSPAGSHAQRSCDLSSATAKESKDPFPAERKLQRYRQGDEGRLFLWLNGAGAIPAKARNGLASAIAQKQRDGPFLSSPEMP